MGRSGMQSFAGFLIVLSLTLLVLFNQHIAAFDWTISSSSSSRSMSAGSKSYGMEGLLRSNMLVGEEMKRKRLQQIATPAPAPALAAAGSGSFISYNSLIPGYVCCPPQTGRSYYTANCQSASGPVHPYTRDCSVMAKCARG